MMRILYFAFTFCFLQPLVLSCWYSLEVADCGGHDIHHATLDHAACEAACSARDDCNSFQLYNGDDCWLKNFICSKRLLTHVGDERYAQYTKNCEAIQQACDYTLEIADCGGHDIRNAKLNLTECEQACTARDDCHSFQLYRGDECWLKNYVCRQYELTHVDDRKYAQYTKQNCDPLGVTTTPATPPPPPPPSTVADDETPGAVQDLLFTMSGTNQAFITWLPPQDKQAVASYIMFWQQVGGNRFERRMASTGQPMEQISLDGLYPGSDYQFRLAAVGQGGQVGEYFTKVVHTPDQPPSGPPTKVTFTVTQTTINVTWQPPAPRHRNGKIVKYELSYKHGQADDSRPYMSLEVLGNRTHQVIGVDQPLLSDETYTIILRAYTIAGQGPVTRRFEVTTVSTVDLTVPEPLRNCTMKRTDDGRKMSGRWAAYPNITTEEDCAKQCMRLPACNAATFKNATKDCVIHARRDFNLGWMGKEGCCVMFNKECSYNGNPHPPPQGNVLCPMEKGAPMPAKKYAYRLTPYKEKYEDGEYLCRIDPICVAISWETNSYKKYFFTFYYKTTPEDGDTVTNMSVAVKNCSQTGPGCNYMSSYFKKRPVVASQYWPTLRGFREKSQCAYACEKEERCDLVTWISTYENRRRNYICQRYTFYSNGRPYQFRDTDRWTWLYAWVKDAPQCNRTWNYRWDQKLINKWPPGARVQSNK